MELGEFHLDRRRVVRVVRSGMDGEVHVALLASPMRLSIAMTFFGQRKPEHVTIELHQPLRLGETSRTPEMQRISSGRSDELPGIRHLRSTPAQSASYHKRLPAHHVPAVPAAPPAADLVAGIQGLSNYEATAQNGSRTGEQGELTNPRAI